MKTYVAEEVLTSWTDGLIVVKAENKQKAMEMIKKEFSNFFINFFDDCGYEEDCKNERCLKHRLRELKDNELVYVHGGD